jgi:hypothetical protein
MILQVFVPRRRHPELNCVLHNVRCHPGCQAFPKTGRPAAPILRPPKRLIQGGARTDARQGALAEGVLYVLPAVRM